MTEPTDAELDSIDMDAKAIANQNPIGTPFAWRKAYLAALARAVLAKWAQPSGAGEPVYQARYRGGYWQDSSRERCEFLKSPSSWHSRPEDWEVRILYTTPQPRPAGAHAAQD